MKPVPEHFDRLGRIINEDATVLAAVDHDSLVKAKVVKLCPILIRVRWRHRTGYLERLQEPHSVLVLPD
jgi:hypothetical protein